MHARQPLPSLPVDGAAEDARRPELLVLAATFREADTEAREELAGTLARLASGWPERVLLHTCHRVELVGAGDPPWSPAAAPGVRLLRGAAAVERVLLVTGGLDSAVVAEEQVLGQVRDAYETALARGETGPILNELFRRALRFGKRVRSQARPAADRSLADVAARWIDRRMAGEPRPHAGSALVVGSGEMAALLAQELGARGMRLTIASRSRARAERLAARLTAPTPVRVQDLPATLAAASEHEVVAIAVRGGTALLEAEHLPPAVAAPLVVDLSAPAAVSADARARLGDRLLDLDGLGHAERAAALTPEADRRLRRQVAEERDRFMAWLGSRAGGDGVRLLTQHAGEVRSRHLQRLRRSGRLDDAQMAAVEAATAAMLGELLHGPIRSLRREPQAGALVRRIFGVDA